MNGWYDFFYYFLIGVTILLSIHGLWFTAILPGIDQWNRRFFRSFFILLIINACFTLIYIAMYYFAPVTAIRFICVLTSLLIVLPLPMLTVLLLHCCKENVRESRLVKTVLALFIVYFIVTTIGLFTDAFIYFTPDKLDHRGSLYPLMLLPVNGIILINLVGTIRRRKLFSRKVYLSFLFTLFPMAFAMLMQMFVNVFLLLDICYTIFALSMYSIILSDQIEQDMRHQREIANQQLENINQQLEIANQRASIMMLQMRPHFIYNTLTSIYCLCKRDPERAPQVVMDFTTYLRKNFAALESNSPIPFTSELDHTRAYLAVELAQHSKSLLVEYDTSHTFFRIPPLTLQPIVENAVKHGMNPYAGPLHVKIRTYHADSDSVIIVEDNGLGFEMTEDSKPYMTLTNIRQRLELMCEGKMEITTRDEGGTKVTITIPDNNKILSEDYSPEA
ncbi:sensor histidine kinase [Oribacterium sp. FC2011]|uniref:sensor histidine kinase n=1 Tax=Oribacterium sp. FC2011 TaxID=1408311 RepID=UPI0004E27B11|nr:histidine kinase [Oribacterium sp. FC2011]